MRHITVWLFVTRPPTFVRDQHQIFLPLGTQAKVRHVIHVVVDPLGQAPDQNVVGGIAGFTLCIPPHLDAGLFRLAVGGGFGTALGVGNGGLVKIFRALGNYGCALIRCDEAVDEVDLGSFPVDEYISLELYRAGLGVG